MRVVVGFDAARGRSIQRSFTVHGDADLAGKARRELVAGYGSTRSGVMHAASVVSVGELLEGYLGSAQFWRPATVASHRHVVSTLLGDPLCGCRLQLLTPAVMRAAICRWRGEGVGPLASHPQCGVLGRGRGHARAEPAGRDARPAPAPAAAPPQPGRGAPPARGRW